MDKSIEQLIENIFNNLHMIPADNFPNIDLYMDQVTTFLNSHFEHSKRFDDDKLLTKTMINNYTKGRLLPPPEKKKYTKNHVIMLTLIYYYKNMLSIHDTKSLMSSLSDKYFNSDSEPNLQTLYERFAAIEPGKIAYLKEDTLNQLEASEATFSDFDSDDTEFLNLLSFISMLSYDIYVKKQIIETLIDNIISPQPEETSDEKNDK